MSTLTYTGRSATRAATALIIPAVPRCSTAVHRAEGPQQRQRDRVVAAQGQQPGQLGERRLAGVPGHPGRVDLADEAVAADPWLVGGPRAIHATVHRRRQ